MCGHGHYRTGAVIHQHEIGDPHRHLLTTDRVCRGDAGKHAFLFHSGEIGLGHFLVQAFINKGRDLRVAFGSLARQRMRGGNGDVTDTHNGVRTRGVNAQRRLTVDGKIHFHAFGATDPVALHGLDLLRPAIQLLEIVKQLIRVLRDADEPLRNFLLLDACITAPAATVDHLFVGQHGLVVRAPVDGGLLAVHQALFVQLGEEPLFPAVVLRATGGDLALPVVAEAEALQLVLHVVDVLVGPLRRRHLVLDGGIFRRQAECVPAHGLQHVLALHALVAADHVADGVVAHVAHVQAAARVGEHRQAIELFLARLFAGLERLRLLPVLLGLLFYLFGTIVIFHGARLSGGRISRGHRIHDRRAGRQRRGWRVCGAWVLVAAGVLCRLIVMPDREQQQCCPSTLA